MSDTFGADPHLNVVIDADADAAADEVQKELTDAFAEAMRSPAVQKAMAALIKSISKQFEGIGKAASKGFEQAAKSARKQADQMVRDFERVAKAANKATQMKGANQPLNVMNEQVAALTNNFEELLNITKTQVRALEELGRLERAASADTERRLRSEVLEAKRATAADNTRMQRQAALIRQIGQVTTATIRGFSRFATQALRSITRVAELTWKSAERAVRAFARGASAAIRGFARVVQSTFTAAGRAVTGFVRTAGRALAGMGRGLTSVLSRMSRAFASAFRRDENAFRSSLRGRERDLQSSLGRQARAQQRFSDAQRRGVLGGLGGAGLLGGVAAGGGILSLLTSGFERFSQEESLQLQFTTLLQSGDKAANLLQQISDYARTTRFDFVEVAGSVAQLTAAFGDADRAFATNRFLADLVSLTGGGTQQFSAARLAFSQIAAAGRLEGQELNQLLESIPGVPIVSILADRFFGGDQAAFQEARRNGELGGIITSDAFFDALEDGARERFPEIEGFAQEVGQTMGGLADNLRENFAIFGAQIISLVEGPLKSGMDTLNRFLAVAGDFITGDIFNRDQVVIGGGAGLLIREDESLERLRRVREILGGMVKTVGGLLGFASALKIVRLAFIGLTSPLGLLITTGAAIGGFFTLLTQNSSKLRSTLKVLGDQILPTARAFQQFFRLLGGALGRTLFGKGDNNIFTRIGDGLRYAIVYIARGVVAIRHFINTLSLLIAAGRLDLLDDVIIGRLKDFSKSIGEFLGGIFNIDQADIDAEGGGIAGFLRNTFLEPVVNFFTNTLPNAIGGFGGLLGDIFNAIFGGDEAAGPGAAFRATEGGEGSIATKILNRLEDTFLGPVLRFFRGPIADIGEWIGARVADFGGFLGDLFNAIFDTSVEGGIGTRIANVLEDTFLGPVVRFFRGPFADIAETIGGAIADVINKIQEFFAPLTSAVSDFLGIGDAGFGEGGFSGILDGLLKSINNIWEGTEGDGGIKAALDGLWEDIKGWFSDTFTPENVTNAAIAALGGIQTAGRKIGEFISDPLFIGIVAGTLAGITLAIAAIFVEFLAGLISGVGNQIDDWARIIVDGLEDAFGLIPSLFDFDFSATASVIVLLLGAALGAAIGGVPGAVIGAVLAGGISSLFGSLDLSILGSGIATALGGVFDSPLFVTSLAIVAAVKFAPKLFSALTAAMSRHGAAGDSTRGRGLIAAIGRALTPSSSDDLAAPAANTASRFIGALKKALPIAAGALLGGAAGFGAGLALGESGAGLLETLLGVGGLSAALLAVSPVAAVASLALGGLGAVIGNMNRESKEARQRVRDLAEEIVGLGDNAGVPALTNLVQTDIIGQITDEEGTIREGFERLVELGPVFETFARQIVTGSGDIDAAVADLATNLAFSNVDLSDTGLFNPDQVDQIFAFIDALNEVTAAGDFTNFNDAMLAAINLMNEWGVSTPETTAIIGQFLGEAAAGGADVEGIFNLLVGAAGRYGDAVELAGDQTAAAAIQIDTVDEAVKALNDSLAGGVTVGEIQRILDSSALGTEDKMRALEDATDDVRDAAREARDAVLEVLLGGTFQETLEDVTRGVRLQFSGLGERLSEEMSSDELAEAIRGIEVDIEQALSDAVTGGLVTDEASFNDFIAGLRSGLDEVPDEIRPDIEAIIDEIAAAGGTIDWDTIADADAAVAAFESAGNQARAAFSAAFNTAIAGSITGVLDERPGRTGLTGGTTGTGGVGAVITSQIGESITANSRDITDAITDAATTAFGDAEASPALVTGAPGVGKKMAGDIGRGLIANTGFATGAARISVNAMILAAASQTGPMYSVGANIGDSLARGMASQIGRAANVAALLAQAAVNAARSRLQISSPSKVFVSIGREIGRGFIAGIKEMEGDMEAALTQAIDNAITKASAATRRAQVASTIFDVSAPSVLPGGTSNLEITRQLAQLNQSLLEFGSSLRDSAASALGASGGELFGAKVGALGARLEFANAIRDVRNQYTEAVAQQNALRDYDKKRYDLWVALTKKQITADQWREAIEKLGDRPVSLTHEQLNRLASGPTSLNAGTTAGQENIAAIQQAVDTIRSFGQAAIEAGTPIATVVAQMRKFVDGIVAEAAARGLNTKVVLDFIDQLGLSSADLAEYQRQLLSLDIRSLAGSANIQQIQEQLQGIRDYAAALLESGRTPTQVADAVRTLRNQLIRAATAFGFNATQLQNLVNTAGLSEAQLVDLIKQMAAFEQAAKGADKAAKDAAAAAEAKRKKEEEEANQPEPAPKPEDPGFVPRPTSVVVNLTTPYGDPEAIGLGVLNAIAMELSPN